MDCIPFCGACCIGPSISSSIPGMPEGKPAGVKCIHLTSDYRCAIYDSPERPQVCREFQADPQICGQGRMTALTIFASLET